MKRYFLIAALTASSLLVRKDALAQNTAATMPTPVYLTNQSAPAFELKDMNGSTVSLADYKGKVVVLDFWATWCGPCKASFPGMQLAVTRYKDDKDVAFLFIDTRQKEENYPELVSKFLADNHYTFKVLFDENGPEGVQNKMFKQYKLIGIPTKFVIDKDGIVRFETIGFMPGMKPEQLADDVAGMIEQAKKPANSTAAKAEK